MTGGLLNLARMKWGYSGSRSTLNKARSRVGDPVREVLVLPTV